MEGLLQQNNFSCEECDFKCSKQSNYQAHLLTLKHKNRTLSNEKMPKNTTAYSCECGKKYKHRNSLWYHKNKCSEKIVPVVKEDISNESTIERLLKENMVMKQDSMVMKKLIMEMMSKIGNTTNSTNQPSS